ncbi:META domain-containing protein [Streptomyces boluensis]|uniref:META domain-containing protein n=1 Tax=Streptomyces boluensis TaxID=1775135 RepID=A0A964UYJ8_9ACTN|nr:META domain-containing protein [Streptomyces boluensis]NBE53925.1 META domain-containing protein [Streptomyces boluensis]
MHTQRKTLSTVGVVSAAAALGLLTACGADQSTAGDAPAEPRVPVTGTHWTVDSVTADGKKSDAPGTKAYVSFDEKGRASGNFGCNGFGGVASVKGDTITVDKIAKTEMSCGDKIDQLETTLTKALKGKLKAKVSGDKLTLTTADGDSVTLSSEPPAELTGTKWKLTDTVEKEVATTLPEKAKDAHLIFDKDGTVHGNLGCNEVNATAKVTDGKIELGVPRLTRKMCPGDVMKSESELVKLFDSKVTYEIEHRTLHITGTDGTGVNASAAPAKQK